MTENSSRGINSHSGKIKAQKIPKFKHRSWKDYSEKELEEIEKPLIGFLTQKHSQFTPRSDLKRQTGIKSGKAPQKSLSSQFNHFFLLDDQDKDIFGDCPLETPLNLCTCGICGKNVTSSRIAQHMGFSHA